MQENCQQPLTDVPQHTNIYPIFINSVLYCRWELSSFRLEGVAILRTQLVLEVCRRTLVLAAAARPQT